MKFGLVDSIVFVLYILGTVIFATWMGSRKKGQSAAGYFKADKQLPWYVVGASIIASGVSSEQFIGTVGIAYLYGMAIANYQWGAPIVYTILIFIFLPFYMRGNVTTMPEFLENRYNKTCRNIYAVVSIVGMVIAMLGGVMFAGAKAVNILFPHVSIEWGIIILAVAAGTYAIYGGLVSSVWADVLQYIVLMGGGLIISLYGLKYSGGIGHLFHEFPEKAIMLYSARHEIIPWTGMLAAFFSVGVWYNCANQVIVQRFIGARSEWDARMGVVMAGFSMAIFPLIIVIPGIVAFYLFHDQLSDGDRSWPYLAQSVLPTGMIGVVLAGLASGIMGTLAAIVNSSSTIITLDLYQPLFRPQATDKELWRVGRISAAICLLIGIAVALFMATMTKITIFEIIQTVFFYMAGPITAIFLVGILWKGATPTAATWTLYIGFASIPIVKWVVFKTRLLLPYDSFPHHTFVVFVFSMITLVILSQFTKPKSPEELKGVIWDKSALRIPESEKSLNRGLRDFRLWWAIMVVFIAILYWITNSQSNGTKWLEAERQNFHAHGGQARIQKRDEIKTDFNLWTAQAQILFTPSAAGDELSVKYDVSKAGNYRLGVMVTRGPGYGKFSAAVNGTSSTISYMRTSAGPGGKGFDVTTFNVPVYDGDISTSGSDFMGRPPDRTVVDRIELGTFPMVKGTNEMILISDKDSPKPAYVGLDQIILTPEKDK